MVVLSVYVCVYLCISGIFVMLSASCHIVTCFFVDVVDFSLMTTLFCFISLDTLLATFCGCIECLCVCLLVYLWDFCDAFCIMSHCDLFLC